MTPDGSSSFGTSPAVHLCSGPSAGNRVWAKAQRSCSCCRCRTGADVHPGRTGGHARVRAGVWSVTTKARVGWCSCTAGFMTACADTAAPRACVMGREPERGSPGRGGGHGKRCADLRHQVCADAVPRRVLKAAQVAPYLGAPRARVAPRVVRHVLEGCAGARPPPRDRHLAVRWQLGAACNCIVLV